MIEWRGFVLNVGGVRYASVTTQDGERFQVLTHFGLIDKLYIVKGSLEEAKAKAEELFTEWLDKAKLMVKPEKCEKCGGLGSIDFGCEKCGEWDRLNEFCRVGKWGHCDKGRCPCTKNPNSLFNVLKRLRG